MHISTLVPEGVLYTVGMSVLSSVSGLHPICTMHTGPRGPLLFGWCTHYVPTTSHQPPATFHTAPTPLHTLQAWLHCHIWTCPSIHVSLCLEEFSPQTSPSGTNYPMVGVLSMCPPHHFSQFPTSGHPCRPAVGGILVPCANRLYGPVLTLWMYHARYESGILQSGCFFDQISRSTPKPAVDIS